MGCGFSSKPIEEFISQRYRDHTLDFPSQCGPMGARIWDRQYMASNQDVLLCIGQRRLPPPWLLVQSFLNCIVSSVLPGCKASGSSHQADDTLQGNGNPVSGIQWGMPSRIMIPTLYHLGSWLSSPFPHGYCMLGVQISINISLSNTYIGKVDFLLSKPSINKMQQFC